MEESAHKYEMNPSTNRFEETNLRSYLNVLWRRKWIVVCSVVMITSLAVGATLLFITPEYKSSAELLQRRAGLDKILLGSDVFQESGVQPDREIQTAAELVKSPEVVSAVNIKLADRLGGRDAASLVDVKPVNKTDILRITATDPDSQLAADVANTFARKYIDWQQSVDKDVLAQARIPIAAQVASIPEERRNSATYQVLADKLETLKLVEAMQVGNLQIVKTAFASSSPASPKLPQTAAIALTISFFTGIGLVFLLEHFDTRIRSTEEITRNLNEPVLGTIPHESSNSGTLTTIANPSSVGAEAFRLLKTNLSYIEPDREIKSIVITSAGPLEGKTTTIANLAITLARGGQRVTILEADFRRPKLPEYLSLDNNIGLTNAIMGKFQLRDVLQMIDVKDRTLSQLSMTKKEKYRQRSVNVDEYGDSIDAVSFNGVKPVYCATSGSIPPNPGELVSSEKFYSLITEAREHSDFVLIDTPPIGVVGDAASMAAKVDGVIMVLRMAKTSKKSFELIRDFSNSIPCNILGVVITDANAPGSNNYRYGGSYYGSYYNY
mgnify:CR=1 FL=1